MTTRAELWAAVDRRKAEHAAGLPYTTPACVTDIDAASRAAERTRLMDPDTSTPVDPLNPGPVNCLTPEEDARWRYADGLHALAHFIEATPNAPLPPPPFRVHVDDADEFDRLAVVVGGDVRPSSPGYEHCERAFGPIRYGVQTDGRKAQQVKRREEAIAQRERELGLSTEDIGQAA